MLDLKLLSGELDARKEEIIGYDSETSPVGKLYADRLRLLDDLDISLNAQLDMYSGSKVLEAGPFVHRFGHAFPSRQEATDWALDVLKDRNVAAVDGSQVYPSRHISVPIGLVQACTVMNSHNGERRFSTNSKLHLMLPADFEENGSYVFAQAPVSTKRFELECQQIGEFMRSHPGDMAFLDGSLVLSFTGQQEEKEQARYIKAITELLDVSEETRSPLIAYTDMSMSKDILTFMRNAFRSAALRPPDRCIPDQRPLPVGRPDPGLHLRPGRPTAERPALDIRPLRPAQGQHCVLLHHVRRAPCQQS